MLVTYFGTITFGAAAQQLPVPEYAAKVYVQLLPGATGNAKVGDSADMTTDTTTPGTFIAPNPDVALPGGDWSLETQNELNRIQTRKYWFHGKAGDKLGYEVQVNV